MLALRLAKFSFADNGLVETQQFSWKHLTQDLVAVFDTFRGDGADASSQVLKVLQGTQVLEVISVESLGKKCNQILSSMEQHRVNIRAEQLPISAIAKCPMLAIRWNTSNGNDQAVMTRRIQLKFPSNEEYDTAFNVLHQLGVRLSQQQQPAQRPSPANAVSSNPAIRANVGNLGPSFPPSRLADISNLSSTALSGSSISPAHRAALLSAATLQPQTGNSSRPTSAYTVTRSNPLVPPEYFPRPASASSILTLQSSNTATATPPQPSFSMLNQPSISPITVMQHHNTGLSSIVADTATSAARPGSAMLYSGPDTSEIVIPPRRELPFGRAHSSNISDGNETPPRTASSGIMGPPPLPSPPRSANMSPSQNRMLCEVLDMPPLARPTIIGGSERLGSAGSSSGRLPSRGTDRASLPQPTMMKNIESEGATTGSSGTRHLSEPNGTAQNTRRSQPEDYLPTPYASEATHQDRVVSELYNNMTANTNAELGAYAMQSDDERKMALNNFIMQHIADENFLTLVQDVSVCWGRIGLGLE